MKLLVLESPLRFSKLIAAAELPEGEAIVWAPSLASGRTILAEIACDAVVFNRDLVRADELDPVAGWRSSGFTGAILVISRENSTAERVSAFEHGADDCVESGVTLRELLLRVRARLRHVLPAEPAVLRTGQIELDRGSECVSAGGVPVVLSRREHELLKLFMLEPGRLLRRTDLVRKIWGERKNGANNLLEVHIYKLRQKMNPYLGRTILRTIRGRGYVLSRDQDLPMPAIVSGETNASSAQLGGSSAAA